MRYLANQDGLVGSRYIREGEEFEYDGAAPSWATPLDPEPERKPEPKPAEEASEPAKKKPVRKLKPKTT